MDGQGNPSIDVELRVSEPDPLLPLRGTVLFGSGGTGVDFYTEQPGGETLFLDLLGRGFRLVEYRWTTGWFESGSSVKQQSARYAILLVWVHDNVHTTGAFCASGNSGAATEIAYALTTWSAGDLLDAAVLTSGPPTTRLDYLCVSPPPPGWAGLCGSIVPPGVLQCGQPECTAGVGSTAALMCAVLPPSPLPGQLEADSILHPAAVLSQPRTLVQCLLGVLDCTVAIPQALLFANALTSPVAVEWVPQTPHLLSSSEQGRSAVVRALLAAAPAQASPATLAATPSPRRGLPLDLLLRGLPGASGRVFVGVDCHPVETAPFGWAFVAPALAVADCVLDARGQARVSLPIPRDAALAGVPLYAQAMVGERWTNLARVVPQY